ncbi:helix-turn-helix domain-containing protein, partial [Streptomyces sp. SMC 277]
MRALKDRSALSYGQLARTLHLSTSSVHRYCSGEAVPTEFATVDRFARACGARPDEAVELHRAWLLADARRRATERAPGPRGPAATADTGEGSASAVAVTGVGGVEERAAGVPEAEAEPEVRAAGPGGGGAGGVAAAAVGEGAASTVATTGGGGGADTAGTGRGAGTVGDPVRGVGVAAVVEGQRQDLGVPVPDGVA